MNKKQTISKNKPTSSTIQHKTENKTENKTAKNQVDSRMKDFISAAVNPDNNAFFEERSNPLCSKGD